MDRKDTRLFDETEIAAILKKAAEHQGGTRSPNETGLSLGELESLASEAGIDPRFVEAAATELLHDQSHNKRTILGGPTSYDRVHRIEGSLSSETWEILVGEMRRSFKNVGSVQKRGDTYEWQTDRSTSNNMGITATPDRNGTRIHLTWNSPAVAAGAFVPVTVLAFILAAAIGGAMSSVGSVTFLQGFLVYAALLTSAFFSGKWLLTRAVNKERDKIDALVSTMDRICRLDSVAGEAEHEPSLSTSVENHDAGRPQVCA